MKILVIGASGQVGKLVFQLLLGSGHSVIGTSFTKTLQKFITLNIADGRAVNEVFYRIKPNIVILTAALTNVDYCEDHRDEAYKMNVLGVENISVAASAYNAKIVYLSTDYIFDGVNGPYHEDDLPNPISYYGYTKLEGEKVVQNECDNWAIVRTTVVFSLDPDSKNFLQQLIGKLSRGEVLNAYTDQVNSPTYALNLAEAVVEIATREDIQGIYNIAGKDTVNRYTFAVKTAKKLGFDTDLIQPVTIEEFSQKAKRPKKAGLIVEKALNSLKTKPLTLDEALTIVKNEREF